MFHTKKERALIDKAWNRVGDYFDKHVPSGSYRWIEITALWRAEFGNIDIGEARAGALRAFFYYADQKANGERFISSTIDSISGCHTPHILSRVAGEYCRKHYIKTYNEMFKLADLTQAAHENARGRFSESLGFARTRFPHRLAGEVAALI